MKAPFCLVRAAAAARVWSLAWAAAVTAADRVGVPSLVWAAAAWFLVAQVVYFPVRMAQEALSLAWVGAQATLLLRKGEALRALHLA